jgi:hypothetical protein
MNPFSSAIRMKGSGLMYPFPLLRPCSLSPTDISTFICVAAWEHRDKDRTQVGWELQQDYNGNARCFSSALVCYLLDLAWRNKT